MRRIRCHLTYANVMATLAVFIVLGGGAYAAAKIGSSDIARNAIKSKHIHENAVKSKHVKDNQIRVQDLAAQAKGARAFALAGRASGFSDRLAHRGFVSAKKDSDGVYCLTPKPGGVDPSTDPPAITPEYYSSNNYDLLAYWGASSSECGDGNYEVRTYAFAGGGQPVLSNQVRFMIVVP
jgi:hypothetical protein